ncbi:DUF6412 domain-containing protein [Streptomyces uncialis]|uniref:DUF6412 domain-containing protein n=1 Tax=Streptomyces uncialis TaxID=1048205 RepID=UPI003652413B
MDREGGTRSTAARTGRSGRSGAPSARHALLLLTLLLEPLLLLLADTGGLAAAVALAAATAATAFAVGTLMAARRVPAVPRTRVRTAIRDRERRTAFLPQRDPDAAGRPRPRAPGRPALTAV